MATFELTKAHPMLRVEALHLSDGRPYIFEDRWISLDTVPEIARVDLTKQNANEWLVLNRPYNRYDLRFYAISANSKTADLLHIESGTALFVMEQTTWIDNAPLTTVQAITRQGYQLLTRS